MPEFSGQVRHSNQNFPVLDLTDGGSQFNQTGKSPVKGIGVFDNLTSRSSITQRYRTKGYLAVVGSTPYVYTSGSTSDSDWTADGNWAGLAATNGIPSGGSTNNVLAKTSDSDYLAGWTGDPIFSTATMQDRTPKIIFSNTDLDTDVIGSIETSMPNTLQSTSKGPKIVFAKKGDVGASHIPSEIQFFTSTDSSQDLAFSINNEKVAIFAGSSSPAPQAGGMYYDTDTNSFYLGINQ